MDKLNNEYRRNPPRINPALNEPSIRFNCTKIDPWYEGRSKYASHPDTKRIGGDDNYFESYDILKCPHCKKEFKIYYEE